MKKFLITAFCLFAFQFGLSQKTYNIDGESIELIIEIDGTMDLLWNVVDAKYRYFVSVNGDLRELTNTKGSDNKFDEEYKSVLMELTYSEPDKVEKVKLTLFSLKQFVNNYNKSVEPGYNIPDDQAKLQARLLVFGGITNHPFYNNPDNISNPLFGMEIEVFENRDRPRHSLLFHVKASPKSDDFEFSNTQLGLGYRLRVISTPGWSLYTTIIGATYNFISRESTVADQVITESDTSFDAPMSFGVGADVKIFKNGFLTVSYDELFGVLTENAGNFSKHLSAGIKLSL
ncbi:MAG: hypothetical protein HKO96_03175 [Flavobacteriaceae bacterium]|nr:hypothetical protein [Flavobacteriaceae bacterium]